MLKNKLLFLLFSLLSGNQAFLQIIFSDSISIKLETHLDQFKKKGRFINYIPQGTWCHKGVNSNKEKITFKNTQNLTTIEHFKDNKTIDIISITSADNYLKKQLICLLLFETNEALFNNNFFPPDDDLIFSKKTIVPNNKKISEDTIFNKAIQQFVTFNQFDTLLGSLSAFSKRKEFISTDCLSDKANLRTNILDLLDLESVYQGNEYYIESSITFKKNLYSFFSNNTFFADDFRSSNSVKIIRNKKRTFPTSVCETIFAFDTLSKITITGEYLNGQKNNVWYYDSICIKDIVPFPEDYCGAMYIDYLNFTDKSTEKEIIMRDNKGNIIIRGKTKNNIPIEVWNISKNHYSFQNNKWTLVK
ncbi:MAG: hypothetical protein BGO87_03480 [Flavobacteriia bacterium 40-80]|nr:MAG: hypothetical protein BGO87_03480 [Flavobacteriia bacterium 40-80]